jgi:hypothetical protein
VANSPTNNIEIERALNAFAKFPTGEDYYAVDWKMRSAYAKLKK